MRPRPSDKAVRLAEKRSAPVKSEEDYEKEDSVASDLSSEDEGDDGKWRAGEARWDLSGVPLKADHEERPLWAFVRDGTVMVFL